MEEVKMDDSRALEVVAREPDPKLSENALRVLQKRYLKKDDTGRVIETPKELFARVAWNLAQAERNYGATEAQIEETARRFFHIISSLEFLPNSPTLMNAGLELQQLSACFAAGTPVSTSLGRNRSKKWSREIWSLRTQVGIAESSQRRGESQA